MSIPKSQTVSSPIHSSPCPPLLATISSSGWAEACRLWKVGPVWGTLRCMRLLSKHPGELEPLEEELFRESLGSGKGWRQNRGVGRGDRRNAEGLRDKRGHPGSWLSPKLPWKWKLLSHVQLCGPRDYTVHGILQARILEWVAFPFSRGSSNPGIKPRSPALRVDSLPAEPPGKPIKMLCIFKKKKKSLIEKDTVNLISVNKYVY